MLAKSASLPSLTAILASSLGAAGPVEPQEWGSEIGRSTRSGGGRSPLPRSTTSRTLSSPLVSQPSLATHRLEHCDSIGSRTSDDWNVQRQGIFISGFRKSKSEADLTHLVTRGELIEPWLATVSEEGKFVRRSGRRRSLSRSRSVRGSQQESCNIMSTAGVSFSAQGYANRLLGMEAPLGEEGDGLMTLTEETVTTSEGRRMICNARGCRPLSDEEIRQAAASSEGCTEEGSATDSHITNSYYLKALEEDPVNALLLRNYAIFLSEIQKDYPRAEEYFERAILASPCDGEVLAQYAKLIHRAYGDVERATEYYERAVKAAPEDCYILASFASFLWSSESTGKVHHSSHGLHREVVHHPEAPSYLIPPVA